MTVIGETPLRIHEPADVFTRQPASFRSTRYLVASLRKSTSGERWQGTPRIPYCYYYGPLARYVKLWVAPGMPGTFTPPQRVSDTIMHHGTCVTHVPWCMPSLTNGFLWSRWRGKRSQHSRRMPNPQFYASGKRPIENIKVKAVARLYPRMTFATTYKNSFLDMCISTCLNMNIQSDINPKSAWTFPQKKLTCKRLNWFVDMSSDTYFLVFSVV